MKRVLLVNPFGTEQGGFSNPPLGLLYIAGTLLKHGFDVRVVDGCLVGEEGVETALAEFRPELVGITCLTPGRKKALRVAQMAKELDRNIVVVMGGAHPTIMHKQIMEHYPFVDFVVLGEGEDTCLEIAQGKDPALINGLVYRDGEKVVKNPPRKYAENLDDLPFPAWHLVDLKKYPACGEGMFRGIDLARETRVSVVFSRGCPGHCDFCSTWWIWKGWRHRSARNMADELEWLWRDLGVRHFCFADDAMTVDRQATLELCDEIIARKLDIAFFATTRTDCVDEELLLKMKEAGCYNISFGIETGSARLLKQMGKENDIARSEEAITICKRIGLRVTALLIIGNVGETEETLRETVAFLKRTQPDEIGCVGGLWVLPGTKLYQQCRRRGIIDDDFWLTDEPYMIYTQEYSLDELARMQQRVTNYRPIWKKVVSRIRKLSASHKNRPHQGHN
ncbi:cobalamin-dependent protein [Geobacter sp.]|uniref:B12-binding domain-containing radical SAM protein n=1 Tax=Geobacter sp. TaxID=46610 RepID=UPI002629A984|nr:cobalamin-dependent protein [Geobacter sp.]